MRLRPYADGYPAMAIGTSVLLDIATSYMKGTPYYWSTVGRGFEEHYTDLHVSLGLAQSRGPHCYRLVCTKRGAALRRARGPQG